jgi:hypothetical protein
LFRVDFAPVLVQGQSAQAVAVLFVMHLAIAVVTYGCLVRIAKTRPLAPEQAPAPASRVGNLR